MSLQKQFEGPDIRSLLDEIHQLYGADTTIAKAEKFRTGGVLGFFQREGYRLVVDGDPKPVDPFAQLADTVVDDAELGGTAPTNDRGPADGTEALLDPSPAAFEDLLHEAARSIHRPYVPDDPEAMPAPAHIPTAHIPTTQNPTIQVPPAEELLGADLLPGIGTGTGTGTGAAPASPTKTPRLTLLTPDDSPAEEDEPIGSWLATVSTAAAARRDDHREEEDPTLADQLLGTGLDAWSVDRIASAVRTGTSLGAAVFELFEAEPPAPRLPDLSGSIIAVVGPAERAMAEAIRIAEEICADPTAVLRASPEHLPVHSANRQRVIRTAGEAAALAPQHCLWWAGVAAVETPLGGPTTWAREIIEALGPAHVVAVVDALHKTEDVAAWLTALGGADTLVLDHPELSTTPARVFDLGIPVTRLGQQAATPAHWTSLIIDRVHGAEAPDAGAPDAEAPDTGLYDIGGRDDEVRPAFTDKAVGWP